MIHVSKQTTNNYLIWLLAVISFGAHLAFFDLTEHIDKPKPKDFGSSQVEIQVPPPKVEQPVKLPHKPVEIPPKKVQKQRIPKANKQIVKKAEPVTTPPKAVFGANSDSVSANSNGPAIRIGNTLEKEMEKKATPLKEVPELPPQPKKPIPIYELTQTPSFRRKVEPDFPEEVRQKGIEGVVQLELLIDEQGKVAKIRVLQAPEKRLALSAIKAAKASLFTPGMIGNKAVPVLIKIPYRFILDS